MSTLAERLATPVPRALRSRPKDARGYPVPFVVLIDATGAPQFTINDARRVRDCRTKHLCALCGKRMDGGEWFIGGPRCFTHPQGAFVDPPNHHDCAAYALRACPYLAAPSYARRIDLGKMRDESYGDLTAIVTYNGMPDDRPRCFGLGRAGSSQYIDEPGVFVAGRWDYVEFWRLGERVNAPDAREVADGLLP